MLRSVQKGNFSPPHQIDPSIDRALEAVCLKAMATDPEARYVSARALSEDVERRSADEPTSAWAEPASVRARRWMRRNRTLVTAATVALVAGVVGLSAVLGVQTKAKNDLAMANGKLLDSLAREEKANADLTKSRAAVQARYDLAVDAIQTFHTGVSEDFLLKGEEFKNLRVRLLKSAADFYGKLVALLGKEADMASRRALAQSNYELAVLSYKVGRKDDALAMHRAVLATREALAAEPSAGTSEMADVGRSLASVARLLCEMGRSTDAIAACTRAESLLAGRMVGDPSARSALAACRSMKAEVLLRRDKIGEAIVSYRLARSDQEALAALPGFTKEQRRELARTISMLGLALWSSGNGAEGVEEVRRALTISQKLADEYPEETDFRVAVAECHNVLALCLANADEKVEEFRVTLEIDRKLARDNPAVSEFQRDVAAAQNNLGMMLSNHGRYLEAVQELRESVAIWRKQAQENRGFAEILNSGLVSSYGHLVKALTNEGKPEEALREVRMALAFWEKLADDNPAITELRSGLAKRLGVVASLLTGPGDREEAMALLQRALMIRLKLVEGEPTSTELRADLSQSFHDLGIFRLESGQTAESFDCFSRERVILEKLVADSSGDPLLRNMLAKCLTNAGVALIRIGRPLEARAPLERARDVLETLARDVPRGRRYRVDMGEVLLRLGQVCLAAGDRAGAVSAWRQAVAN